MEDSIIDRLARIETKLDEALSNISDHEKRLRSVQKTQWMHTGGMAAAMAVLSKFGLPFH